MYSILHGRIEDKKSAIFSIKLQGEKYRTSQNTMYCGGEPEHHIRNVTSLIAHKHVSCTCHESNL